MFNLADVASAATTNLPVIVSPDFCTKLEVSGVSPVAPVNPWMPVAP